MKIDENQKKKIIFYGTIAFLIVEAVLFLTFIIMDGIDIFGAGIGNARSTPVKYAGTLLCVAVSAACIALRGKDGITVTVGLAATAIADLFMLVLDRLYEISLVAFIVAQLVYAFRIYMINGRKPWISIGVRAGLTVIVLGILGGLHSLNLLTALVAIYFPNLLVNMAESFMLSKMGKRYLMFAIGLALFVCCDICVGLNNFGSVLGVNLPYAFEMAVLFAIWIFYLPSQVLIALSVGENGSYKPYVETNEKIVKRHNVLCTVLFGVFLVLFMLTFSIGLPIYGRFFYYIQIKTLKMEESTGWSYAIIKEAYNQVLDYLTLPEHDFGTGMLKFSAEGAAHFADCKVLFDLNISVMILSAAVLVGLIVLYKLKKIDLLKVKGHRAYFIPAIVAVGLPTILAGLVAIDFDRAFAVFHAIFFPGKTNWVFDPFTDEIINVMPQQFFMNCAIIIAVGLIAFALSLIIADTVLYLRERKNNKTVSSEGGV